MSDGRTRAPEPTSRTGGHGPRPPGQPGRPSGASHRAHTLKQRLIAAFTERLAFKATALFFAMVLWLIVSAEEPTSGPVPVRFAPVVDTSLQLVGSLPDISAFVVGTRSDLLRLTTNPPAIHFSVPADVPDTLRLQLDTFQLTMPSGVNVNVQRVQPSVVTLRFGGELRKTVPVRSALRFSADSGYMVAGPPQFSPESVTVIGPRQRVRALQAVPTIATDLVVRDTQRILVPLDTSEIGVRVSPPQVRVRVPIAPDTALPDTAVAVGDRGRGRGACCVPPGRGLPGRPEGAERPRDVGMLIRRGGWRPDGGQYRDPSPAARDDSIHAARSTRQGLGRDVGPARGAPV